MSSEERSITLAELKERLPRQARSAEEIDAIWREASNRIRRTFSKILVLDDDPTGSQTVHHIPVFTSFDRDALSRAWSDPSHTIFVLTNSRALNEESSRTLHTSLLENWTRVTPVEESRDTLVISRGDSTLRGHYPLEPEVIRASVGEGFSGEILIPFFEEGGRITVNDVHYVLHDEILTPAALTEFARDTTFGFGTSNLRGWVEEKTAGAVRAEEVISVSIGLVREGDPGKIANLLTSPAEGFTRFVVNAVTYDDLKLFVAGLSLATEEGARFVIRSAASFVKVAAGVVDQPLLEPTPAGPDSGNGLIVVGSYVGKSTVQLNALRQTAAVSFVPLNVRRALNTHDFYQEVGLVMDRAENALKGGKSVLIATVNEGGREFLSAADSGEHLSDLELSNRISEGLVAVVQGLRARPAWTILKGGITSHTVSVKGIGVKRALVAGQIEPGVTLWEIGDESKWPGMPLVIFPGNVGDDQALARVAIKLGAAPLTEG